MWYADRKIKHLFRIAIDKKMYMAEVLSVALNLPVRNISLSNKFLIDSYTAVKGRDTEFQSETLVEFNKKELSERLKPSQITTILNYFYSAGIRYNVEGRSEIKVRGYRKQIYKLTLGQYNHIPNKQPRVRRVVFQKPLILFTFNTDTLTAKCEFYSEYDNIKYILDFEDTFKNITDIIKPKISTKFWVDASLTNLSEGVRLGTKGVYLKTQDDRQKILLKTDTTLNKVSYIEELRAVELALQYIDKHKDYGEDRWDVIYTEAFYLIPLIEGRRRNQSSIEKRYSHTIGEIKDMLRRNRVILVYVKAHHKTEDINVENKIVDINCKNFMKYKTVVLPKTNHKAGVEVEINGEHYIFEATELLRTYNNNLDTIKVKKVKTERGGVRRY